MKKKPIHGNTSWRRPGHCFQWLTVSTSNDNALSWCGYFPSRPLLLSSNNTECHTCVTSRFWEHERELLESSHASIILTYVYCVGRMHRMTYGQGWSRPIFYKCTKGLSHGSCPGAVTCMVDTFQIHELGGRHGMWAWRRAPSTPHCFLNGTVCSCADFQPQSCPKPRGGSVRRMPYWEMIFFLLALR